MIEWLKMQDNQWVIRRKDKTYPIKNLESLFVYSLAFSLNLKTIESTLLKMHRENKNYAAFQNGILKLLERR